MRGRAERPSAKKSLGRRGMYFGWSCMSWRQADSRRSDIKRMVGRTPGSAADAPVGLLLWREAGPGGPARTRGSAPPSGLPAFLMRNFRYLPGLQRFQELARLLAIEERIDGFDAQEETIATSLCEARHVERGVMGQGRAGQAKESKNGGEPKKKNIN